MAFSPKDWKESYKTSFGFIFQRPGLRSCSPRTWPGVGDLGDVKRRRKGIKGLASTPSFPHTHPPPKITYKENLCSAGRPRGASPTVG